jgi:hypothetical protein
MQSALLGDDLQKLYPIMREGASDSAQFDNALEFLVLTGRELPEAILMMIPEAWENRDDMDPELRAFYEYHSFLMEPWDGPASLAFTDGRMIGAVLDRNGLRPSRYVVTKDGFVVMASEVGVVDVAPENVLQKERLHPGKIFCVDLEQGRIIEDEEIKRKYVSRGAGSDSPTCRALRVRHLLRIPSSASGCSRCSGTPARTSRSCSPRWR